MPASIQLCMFGGTSTSSSSCSSLRALHGIGQNTSGMHSVQPGVRCRLLNGRVNLCKRSVAEDRQQLLEILQMRLWHSGRGKDSKQHQNAGLQASKVVLPLSRSASCCM